MDRNKDGNKKQMKKFEEILKYHPQNLNIYERLVRERFIPFVGAGLSAGIGIGSWKELFIIIAKEICFNHTGTTEDIDWETGLLSSESDMEKVNDICNKIREIENSDKLETELEKIKKICECLDECVRKNSETSFSFSIIFSLFVKVLNSDGKYSAYSAGEILKLEDETVYDILKTQVCKNQKKTGHWEVSKDRAVYWLCYIIKNLELGENNFRFKCVTINFDNIIEDVYGQLFFNRSQDKNPIFHLHGSVENKHEKMCVALSDLLRLYPEQLTESVHGRVFLQQVDPLPYLFLGTSFSEDHIGKLLHEVESGNNFAIAGVSNNNEKEITLKKAKAFQLNSDTILYYKVENGDHSELVTLLHQLARDKAGIWNNWGIFETLLKRDKKRKEKETEAAKKAIKWLEQGEDSCGMLYVEVDSLQDSDNFAEGKLFVNNIEKLYFFLEKIKDRQKGTFRREDRRIPQYRYSVFSLSLIELKSEEIATVLETSDIEPLGDSVYIFFLSKNEATDGGNVIKGIILDAIKKSQIDGIKCKIVIISFSDADKLTIATDCIEQLMSMAEKLFEGEYLGIQRVTQITISMLWRMLLQELKKGSQMLINSSLSEINDLMLYKESTKNHLEERNENVKRTSQGQILQRKLSRED